MKFTQILESLMEDEVDSEEVDSEEIEDVESPEDMTDEYKEQAIEIMANALAAGVSEVEEQLGIEGKIESTDDAVKFVTYFITLLRVSKRDVLRKALRRYERLGKDRFRRDYRKQLAREKGDK